MTPPAIACLGVTKTFSEATETAVLHGVSFEVAPGQQVALCGPSGSGKSTLMNILGLLDVPSTGRYELFGEDTSSLSEAERAGLRASSIGFVFQSFHLLASRSAEENVEVGLLYSGKVARRRRRDLARDNLERVGLGHRAGANVTTLSGGERQRVAIARALAQDPKLLLADEPTGNLDSESSEQIMQLLGALHAEGLTQVIVTHSGQIADRIGRRFDVLDGRIVEHRGVAAS